MAFEYAWSVVSADCSEQEAEVFLDSQKSYLKKNSQHEVCAVCVPRYVDHTMHYVVHKCNARTCREVSRGRVCEWYIKSGMCDLTKRCAIYQHGYHVSIVASPPRPRLNLAIKFFVREQTDAKLKPSRIINEMIDTFILDTDIDLLPRVQRYSHCYRTSQLADSNNVDDMEALIMTNRYHSHLDEKLVFRHVYRIQYSRSREDFAARVSEALGVWKSRLDCVEFERKFSKQWLSGRFTDWQCLSSPVGFAKTNNPVEQFNKQLERDYTLRMRINVNMLAQELLKLSRHQAARQKAFELGPRLREDQIGRYKALKKDDRLVVTS